ncbi:MAG: HD-GYP domain-containing protein [Planctomycetes bacterium]|nr:HD-GYP domain-containing protein [Planctomycetota bacterium]
MRVSYYTCFLAILMDCPEDDLQDFYRGALLHDIGKIGIPDAILLKPAKLDEEEFETMKRHTTLGRDFLCGIDYLSRAIDIPYCHHEKWNGTGYPQGLEGERIPFGARLFAVADVYDALRSRRCYKDPMSHETALGIIVGDSGTHFDPAIVAAFERVPEATWSALDVAARREVNDFRSMVAFCRDAVAALDEAEVMEPVS